MTLTFRATLRDRILIVLLTLTALPALLIGGFAYVNAYEAAQIHEFARLASIADLKQMQINIWLDDRDGDDRLLAENFANQELFTELLSPSTDANRRAVLAGYLTESLKTIQMARKGGAELLIVDASGRVAVSTDSARVGVNMATDSAVVNTLKSPTPEHNEDIHRQADGSLVMDFGHVLHRVDLHTKTVLLQVNGALILRVHLADTLYPLLRAATGMGDTGETLLVRRDGNASLFLTPLRFKEDAALNWRVPHDAPNARPAHLATTGSEGIIETTDYRGVPVLAAYRAIPRMGWGLVVKQDSAEAFAPLGKLTRQWLALTALALLVAAGIAYFLARALTQPLSRLLAAVQAVAAGDFNRDLPSGRNDEIGQLTAAFRTMQDNVRVREADHKTQSVQLAALNRLTDTINSTLDIQVALDAFMKEAQILIPLDRASVGVVDEHADALRILAASGLARDRVGRNLRIQLKDNAHAAQAIARRRPVIIDDMEREQWSSMDSQLLRQGIRSAMSLPLVSRGQVIGVLNLGARAANAYASEHVVLLTEQIAAQFATVVAKVGLYEEERERASQLATLSAISTRIMSILQVDELLQQIVSATWQGFGFSRTSIALVDGDALLIKAGACKNCDPCPDIGTRLPLTDPAELASTQLGATSKLALPLRSASRLLGVMTVTRADERPFVASDVPTLQLLASQIVIALQNADLHQQVLRESITDGLTGLNNRRYLDIFLKRELAACERYHHGLAVLMLDADHFKHYNDTHGHAAGDRVLSQMARILEGNVRAADLVARYGGEEFTVVMPEAGLQDARVVAEKIRSAVEAFAFENAHVTVSIGVAAWSAGQGQSDVLARADQALYRAKNEGRNRIAT